MIMTEYVYLSVSIDIENIISIAEKLTLTTTLVLKETSMNSRQNWNIQEKAFRKAFHCHSQQKRKAHTVICLSPAKTLASNPFPSLHFRFIFYAPREQKLSSDKKNIKKLCICGDRKYCNVIQHNKSFFKQHFRFVRQQTECTLHYNGGEDANGL